MLSTIRYRERISLAKCVMLDISPNRWGAEDDEEERRDISFSLGSFPSVEKVIFI